MFGKKVEIALYESEKLLHECEFKEEGKFNKHDGLSGRLFITNLRMHFYYDGIDTDFPHELITSFIWDEGRFKGNNFKFIGYLAQIPTQLHLQVKGKEKKKITALLNQHPYYNKPAVLKPWPHGNKPVEVNITSNNPLTILKQRYAKGEITKEMFEEMKKDLEQS